jgi:hypothetical protein
MTKALANRVRRDHPDYLALGSLLEHDRIVKDWLEGLGSTLWHERKRLYPGETDTPSPPEEVTISDYKPAYTLSHTPVQKSHWRMKSAVVTGFDSLIEGSVILLYERLLNDKTWQLWVVSVRYAWRLARP